MGRSRKRGAGGDTAAEQEVREQEVARANKELAAYFKGLRTEREARAALKIIKGFIRHRERVDPESRRPLPGAVSAKSVKASSARPSEPFRRHVRSSRRHKAVPTVKSSPHDEAPSVTNDEPREPDGDVSKFEA